MKLNLMGMILLILLLMGCQSTDEDVLMIDASDVVKVALSKSDSWNKLNDEFFLIVKEDEELDIFKEAFVNAKREKRSPEAVNYDLLITDAGGDDYLLQGYIGEEGEKSAFFFIGHEDSVYFTTKEMTDELRKIIVR